MLSEYVEKIMRKGISNFAKQASKPEHEVQILICWDSEANAPKYKKLILGESSKEVTFNEILDVKFDMLNRGMIVGQFIATTFSKYCESLQAMPSELFVLILLEQITEEDDELKLYLYRKSLLIKELQLEQLLT